MSLNMSWGGLRAQWEGGRMRRKPSQGPTGLIPGLGTEVGEGCGQSLPTKISETVSRGWNSSGWPEEAFCYDDLIYVAGNILY